MRFIISLNSLHISSKFGVISALRIYSLWMLLSLIKSSGLDDITFLPFEFLAAFVIQVIFMLGVFAFSLWHNSRSGISGFKEFSKVSSSINKLCGLCFYVILYLIAVYTTNKLAVKLSAYYEPPNENL